MRRDKEIEYKIATLLNAALSSKKSKQTRKEYNAFILMFNQGDELSEQQYKDIKAIHLKFGDNKQDEIKLLTALRSKYIQFNFDEIWFLRILNCYTTSPVIERGTYSYKQSYHCFEFNIIYNFIKNNLNLFSKGLSTKIINIMTNYINGLKSIDRAESDSLHFIYTIIILLKENVGFQGYNQNILNSLCKFIGSMYHGIVSLHDYESLELKSLQDQFIGEEKILIEYINHLITSNNNTTTNTTTTTTTYDNYNNDNDNYNKIQLLLSQLIYFCSNENKYEIYQLIDQETDLVPYKECYKYTTKKEYQVLKKKDIGFLVEPLIRNRLFTYRFYSGHIRTFKGGQYKSIMKLGINQCIELFRKSITACDQDDYSIFGGLDKIGKPITLEKRNENDSYLDFKSMGLDQSSLYKLDESLIIHEPEKLELEKHYQISCNNVLTGNHETDISQAIREITILSTDSKYPIRRSVFIKNITNFIISLPTSCNVIKDTIYPNFKEECDQLISNNSIVKQKLLSIINSSTNQQPINPKLSLLLIKEILKLHLQDCNASSYLYSKFALLSKDLYNVSKSLFKSIPIYFDPSKPTLVPFKQSNIMKSDFSNSVISNLQYIKFNGYLDFKLMNTLTSRLINPNTIDTIEIVEVKSTPVLEGGDLKKFPNLSTLILRIDIFNKWDNWTLLFNNSKYIQQFKDANIKLIIHLNITKRDFTDYKNNKDGRAMKRNEKQIEILQVIERENQFESKHGKFLNYFKLNQRNQSLNLDLNLFSTINVNIGTFLKIFKLNPSITNYIYHLKINASKYFEQNLFTQLLTSDKEIVTGGNVAPRFGILEFYFEHPRSIERILNIFKSLVLPENQAENKLHTIKFHILFDLVDKTDGQILQDPSTLSNLYSTIFGIISTSSKFSNVSYISIQNLKGDPISIVDWNSINFYSFKTSPYNFIEFNRNTQEMSNDTIVQELPSQLYGNDIDEDGYIDDDKYEEEDSEEDFIDSEEGSDYSYNGGEYYDSDEIDDYFEYQYHNNFGSDDEFEQHELLEFILSQLHN